MLGCFVRDGLEGSVHVLGDVSKALESNLFCM